MGFLILSIEILLIGAFLIFFVKNKYKLKFCSIFTFISSFTAFFSVFKILANEKLGQLYHIVNPIFNNITFSVDFLSLFFILIISIMSFMAVVYSNGYLKHYIEKNKNLATHCSFMMVLIASMYAVTIVTNALFFLIVWEFMSIASFFLVLFNAEEKIVRKAGIKYLVYMHLSVIFLMAMFAVLINASNSFYFDDFKQILVNNASLANTVFILGFIGFGIKAGFVPFHNWLPDAHPAAPSHISGMMSGVMIKTGIYGILRVLYLIGTPSKLISYLVLAIAVLTVLYGVLYAITQHDIKRLLAYSSIENIGIIGIGIGVGMLGLAYNNHPVAILGFSGGIFHILNHSIFKELMFFAAGNIYLKTHTRNIESLGGLIKKMPYTGIFFILGSLAISGLPPFNGFIGEFLIYAGMLIGIPSSEINLFIVLVISISALALAGTMAIVCFSKASGITLLGLPRTEKAEKVINDVEYIMITPIAILAIATLLIGLFPQYFINVILAPVILLVGKLQDTTLLPSIIGLTQVISQTFLIFLVLVLIILSLRFLKNKKSRNHETWGCGYDRVNPHMQYTPSSYDNLFVSTLKPLFKRISHIKKPKDLFPKDAYFELEIEDIEEAYIVEPIIKLDEKILTKFERIQNGNMQQYILFGLIFLIVAIVGLILFGG
ncbi:hydrogenase [bacterium]|nr:hydrogenase [bacterium]